MQSTDNILITGAADFIGTALVQEIKLTGEINTAMPDHDLLLLSTAHEEYRRHDFSAFKTTPLVDTRNAVAPQHRPERYLRA